MCGSSCRPGMDNAQHRLPRHQKCGATHFPPSVLALCTPVPVQVLNFRTMYIMADLADEHAPAYINEKVLVAIKAHSDGSFDMRPGGGVGAGVGGRCGDGCGGVGAGVVVGAGTGVGDRRKSGSMYGSRSGGGGGDVPETGLGNGASPSPDARTALRTRLAGCTSTASRTLPTAPTRCWRSARRSCSGRSSRAPRGYGARRCASSSSRRHVRAGREGGGGRR
eukprot:364447-Chlamydomonas_euryale.AAC.6